MIVVSANVTCIWLLDLLKIYNVYLHLCKLDAGGCGLD